MPPIISLQPHPFCVSILSHCVCHQAALETAKQASAASKGLGRGVAERRGGGRGGKGVVTSGGVGRTHKPPRSDDADSTSATHGGDDSDAEGGTGPVSGGQGEGADGGEEGEEEEDDLGALMARLKRAAPPPEVMKAAAKELRRLKQMGESDETVG